MIYTFGKLIQFWCVHISCSWCQNPHPYHMAVHQCHCCFQDCLRSCQEHVLRLGKDESHAPSNKGDKSASPGTPTETLDVPVHWTAVTSHQNHRLISPEPLPHLTWAAVTSNLIPLDVTFPMEGYSSLEYGVQAVHSFTMCHAMALSYSWYLGSPLCSDYIRIYILIYFL